MKNSGLTTTRMSPCLRLFIESVLDGMAVEMFPETTSSPTMNPLCRPHSHPWSPTGTTTSSQKENSDEGGRNGLVLELL